MENENFEEIKSKIVEILKKNKIKKAGIFGSYARGEQTKNSDIDILIEAGEGLFSLLDLVNLEFKIEGVLKKDVDLITYKSINHLLRNGILNEEIRII